MHKAKKSSKQEAIDDEQIEKTLNFFDSILDPYLEEDEEETVVEKKLDQQVTPANSTPVQPKKHSANGISSNKKPSSVPAPSSSPQRPAYVHARRNHSRYEPFPLAIPAPHVRRYTSENNLNQISSPTRPAMLAQKPSFPVPVRTSAASIDDLSTAPSWKNFSRHTRLSAYTDKTNGTSASLIDLTSIDEVSSPRPRYRFIPPSSTALILREEPEIEQQERSRPRPDKFHLKALPYNQLKYSHKIIKPTVIIPPKPKSAPVARLAETNIQHQTNNSAFKPPRSRQSGSAVKASLVVAAAPVVASTSNHKRTEGKQKPNVHMGITSSSNQLANSEFLFRHRPTVPPFHQSMLNLSSAGVPDARNSNMFASRVLYPPSSSANFIHSPPYIPNANKMNRHFQYPPPPTHFDDAVTRRMQQVKPNGHVNGLVHPSYHAPFSNGAGGGGGGGGRSQQRVYPYNPYVSASSGLSSPRSTYDYLRRQQAYLNPVKVHKHHSPQNPAPVQSTFLASLPLSENGIYPAAPSDIYYFNQSFLSNDGQSRSDPHHENFHIATYL